MPRPSADHAVPENVFAAIDTLTLFRHVADFPKTRQTRPTSPPTPRATTGSSSQERGEGGGGREAARSAAGNAQDFSKAKIPQIVVNSAEVRALNPRSTPRSARRGEGTAWSAVMGTDVGSAISRAPFRRLPTPEYLHFDVKCAEVRALGFR
ncbi:hypothetical protein FB107DRAFT_273029 [Schizophyllum commune]